MSYYYEGIEENSFTLTRDEAILKDLVDELKFGSLTPKRCMEIAEFEEYFSEQISCMSEEEKDFFWEFRSVFHWERLKLFSTPSEGSGTD